MPADAASPPPLPRSRNAARLRAGVVWMLGVAVTIGLSGLLAWAGILLAVFGLAGVALAVAAVMTAVGVTVWRRGMLPMAVLSTALVLPAAAVALGHTRFDQSIGLLEVRPQERRDIADERFRRGSGPVFLDLRNLDLPRGSTTRVQARADNGPVIVALPHDACIQTHVRYRIAGQFDAPAEAARSSLRAIGIDSGNRYGMALGPMGLTRAAGNLDERLRQGFSWEQERAALNLNAYGRTPIRGLTERGGVADWTHEVADPGAAKLELDLAASEQITLRDYPQWAAPLSSGSDDGYDQVAGYGWPESLQAPLSPGAKAWAHRSEIRTLENRARWLRWEREIVKWGTEQARRYAGPCATRRELRERGFWFQIQPEAASNQARTVVNRLVSSKVPPSRIEQRVAHYPDAMFGIEVNGLGETTVVGESRTFRPGTVSTGQTKAAR